MRSDIPLAPVQHCWQAGTHVAKPLIPGLTMATITDGTRKDGRSSSLAEIKIVRKSVIVHHENHINGTGRDSQGAGGPAGA